MKQKALIFVGAIVVQLMIANCVALGISLNELYGEIADSIDRRHELKKAEKELKKKAKMAKEAA